MSFGRYPPNLRRGSLMARRCHPLPPKLQLGSHGEYRRFKLGLGANISSNSRPDNGSSRPERM